MVGALSCVSGFPPTASTQGKQPLRQDLLEVGVSFQKEGTYVYLWLIHVDVWQKLSQHCKAIIFQLKLNKFIKRSKEKDKSKKEIFPWL